MANIDYGKILSESFTIVKKNKWLWIYGLVLAITTGSGFNIGGGGGNSKFEIPREIPRDLPEKTTNVLGQTTTAVQQWFAHVPVATWIMLVLGILTLILVFVLVYWIVKSWAKAGLIYGISLATAGKDVKLPETSRYGISKIRELIIYSLIALGIAIATLSIAAVIMIVGFILLAPMRNLLFLWFIFYAFVVGGSLFVLFILYAMIAIYAERLIVLYGYAPWTAWKKALSLSKKNFFSTFSMGAINMTVGCMLGCFSNIGLLLILGIPVVLLLLPSFKNGLHFPSVPTISAVLSIFMLFIWINYVIRAILVVFNYSIWNLFFLEIVKKEGNV